MALEPTSHIPAVSVILPVYNAERFLAQTIQSVLNQSFKDFELIIINDGSTDASASIIQQFTDPRIIYIQQKNFGLAQALNTAIDRARAPLIARQDNDDLSHESRLEKQVAYINAHAKTVLLGTWARIIDEQGQNTGRTHRHLCEDMDLKFFLLFDNPFVHSSVMFKKEAWAAAGKYSLRAEVFEDYNLWSAISQLGDIANLPEYLLDYREVQQGMSKSSADYTTRVQTQCHENIAKTFNLSVENVQTVMNDLSTHPAKLNQQLALWEKQFSILHVSPNFIGSKALALVQHNYKRALFNQLIQDPQASFFSRLTARIKRYLLIKTELGL